MSTFLSTLKSASPFFECSNFFEFFFEYFFFHFRETKTYMGWFVLWHLFTIQTVIWRYYSSRQRWLKKQVPQSASLSTLYLESLTAHLTWGAIHRSQFCFGAASHWTRVSLWWSSIRPKLICDSSFWFAKNEMQYLTGGPGVSVQLWEEARKWSLFVEN